MTDTTYPTDTIQDSERPKGWRDLYPPHPAAELFPLMTAEELGGLTADIERHGLREPITLHDEGGQCWVLDGRNRMDALALLGKGLSEDGYGGCHFEYPGLHDPSFDPFTFVVSRNLHRRHLTVEQRKEVAAKLLAINPAQSNRQVAKATGIDHKTVATVRAAGEATGEIPQLEKTIGIDGRERPARPLRSFSDRPLPPEPVTPAQEREVGAGIRRALNLEPVRLAWAGVEAASDELALRKALENLITQAMEALGGFGGLQ